MSWTETPFGSDQISAYRGDSPGPIFPHNRTRPTLGSSTMPMPMPMHAYPYFPYSNMAPQYMITPVGYMPELPRPWSSQLDTFSLQSKLNDNNAREPYQKREYMSSGNGNCVDSTPIINMQLLCYIFIFIIIILLAFHHMMNNAIDHLKELFRLTSNKGVAT
jgi:hypothetical protein